MSKKKKEVAPVAKMDNRKIQLETFFNPWVIKKWATTKYGHSFTLEIKDSVEKRKHEQSDINAFFFEDKEKTSVINVTSNQIISWANGSLPAILIYSTDEKISYLLLEEHFLNTLFSENPSRTAQDKITITSDKFTTLTKPKIKTIREFVFKWKKITFSVLQSGTYFKYKDALKKEVEGTLHELSKLKVDVNLSSLADINEEINRAIYTVAIVGATKAGKSTIINSLVSKYVSPVDIRPTTGIPTNIVPGREEKAEILLQDEKIIPGPADESFLNQYVSIDQNRSNHKKVKMVTVWVQSAQMEKGLSFCDFPGLDDADPVIERTVANALQFVNAIIYVIDASGMTSGFKFPKQYRDDLLNLKHKDRIFLVINKIDHFTDPQLLNQFKDFIEEQLELLELKSLFAYPPIYMTAKKSFEERKNGIHNKDEMTVLESQVWDHLLANSKSGMHNLMNIIGQVNQESERLSRMLNLRVSSGDKQKELRQQLTTTEQELNKIRAFEKQKRMQIEGWLVGRLATEKHYLINYYRNYLQGLSLNEVLPNDNTMKNYLVEQFTLTAPELFEELENEITKLHNDLNQWVNNKLQSVEISIDTYTKHQFRNSETFFQLLQPISNIFSESYGKSVPTNMIGNIFYHIFNAIEWFGDALWEIFTNNQTVRNTKINGIIRKLNKCYEETFDKIHYAFNAHLQSKCAQLLSKVVDRTTIYVAGMKRQISELNTPLSDGEKKLYEIAMENLVDLDNHCSGMKLEIEELTSSFKPKTDDTIENVDKSIETIEMELRSLINSILTNHACTTDAKKIVLSHLQPKVEERISKMLRDHPGTPATKYATFESQLQFFDMSEYFEMISNKAYWPLFKDIFNNKENLNKHILQLSNLRNAIRHSREQTKLILTEGLASILWFNMALKIKSSVN